MARVIPPNFLKKCLIQPISQDQWQIVKFILEFESTHQMGISFDGIRFGWIFSLLKDLFHNVTRKGPWLNHNKIHKSGRNIKLSTIRAEVIWCLEISILHRNPEFLSFTENLFGFSCTVSKNFRPCFRKIAIA